MRPKPQVLSATSSEQTLQFGGRSMLIKNIGDAGVLLDFDASISDQSYLLEDGESITIEWQFQKLYYKTSSGTATLHVIKILQ